jgi:hypothetical protein
MGRRLTQAKRLTPKCYRTSFIRKPLICYNLFKSTERGLEYGMPAYGYGEKDFERDQQVMTSYRKAVEK